MRLCYWGKDGGTESTVWGFWLVELKSLFSVALLKFVGDSREVYHNHAFHSISWVLKGKLTEDKIWFMDNIITVYKPSLKPVFTNRYTLHKVDSTGVTWVLTLRGPWSKYWSEWLPKEKRFVDLAHGRAIV